MQPPANPEAALTIPVTAEAGEVAAKILRLSRDGNGDVGEIDSTEREGVREKLGMEIHDAMWNLLDLAEMAGLDEDREWRKAAGGRFA